MGGGEGELSDSTDMKLQISQHYDDRNDSVIAQGWLGEEMDCKGARWDVLRQRNSSTS